VASRARYADAYLRIGRPRLDHGSAPFDLRRGLGLAASTAGRRAERPSLGCPSDWLWRSHVGTRRAVASVIQSRLTTRHLAADRCPATLERMRALVEDSS
jgi:hypothetical protein